jgi:CubicO group peptidase (beta-lactamase class C family)
MHTSGLQGEPPWQSIDRMWMYRPEELLKVLPLARVTTPPELDGKYSNLGYQLLGLIVERVAGRPFTDHVRASILDPLGMTDTVWDPDGAQAAREAVGYDARSHDDHPSMARHIDSHLAEANGGLWSTLEDMGSWIRQQLRTDASLERGDGQVLRGATLAEMHRPSFVVTDGWTEAQGLGWYGTRSGETILIGHAGFTWGFSTNISFSRPGRVGAIVLLNGMGDADTLARELLEVVLPAIREAHDRAEVPPFARTPDECRELLGVYRDPEFGLDYIVDWRDGKLVLLIGDPEAPSHDLEPTDDPLAFTMRGGRPNGEPLVFSRGTDGRIDRCNAAGYPALRVDLLHR